MNTIEVELFRIFSSFIRDLSKTYPEIKNCLYRNYEYCMLHQDEPLNNYPKLEYFLELIGKYEKYITDKNSEFFDLEIELLEEISFKKLWSKNISGKTRETIWKYLQTFQIININLKSNEELKETLKNIGTDTVMEVDKNTVKELKKLKKLSSDVKEKVPQGEDELDDMLGDLMNTGIGEVAKEVAENINIESMFSDMNINENTNPMEIMSHMMNPEKMGSIFQNINSVMDKKMKNGELNEDSLKKEAEGMMGQMSTNPLFSNMMGQMNSEQMNSEQMNSKKEDSKKEDSKEEDSKEEDSEIIQEVKAELTREEIQKKLREKIKEKKKNR